MTKAERLVNWVRTKLTCSFCQRLVSRSNHPKHENSCVLNPKNVRLCPTCLTPLLNKRHETCSLSCSNVHFRTKLSKAHRELKKEQTYKDICFAVKPHKCTICDEIYAVDVHHLDEDKNNNHIENLVPLCANHHRHFHMKNLKQEILRKIRSVV